MISSGWTCYQAVSVFIINKDSNQKIQSTVVQLCMYSMQTKYAGTVHTQSMNVQYADTICMYRMQTQYVYVCMYDIQTKYAGILVTRHSMYVKYADTECMYSMQTKNAGTVRTHNMNVQYACTGCRPSTCTYACTICKVCRYSNQTQYVCKVCGQKVCTVCRHSMRKQYADKVCMYSMQTNGHSTVHNHKKKRRSTKLKSLITYGEECKQWGPKVLGLILSKSKTHEEDR
jgi:hypothetical protein